MARLVMDTNVLASALLNPNGTCHLIVRDYILTFSVQLCLSDEVFDEYDKTIRKQKFIKYPDFLSKALTLIRLLDVISERHTPTIPFNQCPDVDDNKFMSLALTAKANYLVTGNAKHFPFTKVDECEILSPRAFLDRYEN